MVHTHLFHHFSYSSVEPTIGQGVTDSVIQECPSFYYEEVPIYYDTGHRQLKDEERFVSDKLHLSVTACWALERNTRDQANSLIWMEQRKKEWLLLSLMMFTAGRGVKEGMQRTSFLRAQLHQYLYNEDWIKVKYTSKFLGKKYLESILFP